MRFALVLLCCAISLAAQAEMPAVDRLASLPTAAARRQAIESEEIPVTTQLIQSCIERGAKQLDDHQFTDSEAWDQLAIDLAVEIHALRLEASGYLSLSYVLGQQNRYERSRDAVQHSLAIARELQDQPILSAALSRLASVDLRLGKEQEAVASARQALAAAATVSQPASRQARIRRSPSSWPAVEITAPHSTNILKRWIFIARKAIAEAKPSCWETSRGSTRIRAIRCSPSVITNGASPWRTRSDTRSPRRGSPAIDGAVHMAVGKQVGAKRREGIGEDILVADPVQQLDRLLHPDGAFRVVALGPLRGADRDQRASRVTP